MASRDLAVRRETTDGQRPSARHLDPAIARKNPLVAFAVLRSGDVFDAGDSAAAKGTTEAATAAVDATVRWSAEDAQADAARADMIRQLSGNARLAARMAAAKPIDVDLVRSRADMVARGYPRSVAKHAAGLFWDHPDWPRARIALRKDRLGTEEEETLVVHEYAHAIHYLGFTADERKVISGVLAPVFGHPSDQDEVFAIYSEREFLDRRSFSRLERSAPGVYGVCRQQWSEDHAFAAFVKKLYHPASGVRAGDRERRAAMKWKAFSQG
ncbi:MAG: hypothetical protein AAFV29_26955 [Myxococcota bacterium]